jgi:hypothetical protein
MLTATIKKLHLSILVTPLLLSILTGLVFATPANASEQLPFKGTLQAFETHEFDFPNQTLMVTGNGSGNATHLGRYSVEYDVSVSLLSGGGPASIRLEGANGDAIFATGFGQGTPTAIADVSMIVETYTITDGTGRFAGASGSFTVVRLVNRTTGVTSGTFDGNIVIP